MGSHDGRPEEPGIPGSDGTRSDFSGRAREVIQARDVRGGVHFHHTGPLPGPIPRQLPGDARGFVNRVSEIERLTEVLTRDADDPHSMIVLVIVGTAGWGKPRWRCTGLT